MSNEERNDEMVDESSEMEEQDEEYSFTDEPKSSGGGSAGIWVIIILVIVALIAIGAHQWISREQAQRQQELEQRERVRQQQLSLIAADVPEAEQALASGDIDAMVEKLQQMDQKLQILAASANSAGDTDEAQRIAAMRTPVQEAIKSLQPIYEQIKAKREEIKALEAELSTTAASSLDAVRARFGGVDAAGAEPADLPADEPAVTDEAPAEDEPVDEEAPVDDEMSTEEAPAAEAAPPASPDQDAEELAPAA